MKQAINTRTQEEYDALMKYYESKGKKWAAGELPTTKSHYWRDYKEKTCVTEDEEKLGYSPIGYFEIEGYEIIPFTEFAKANIVEEKRCELGCKIFTGGEIKHHKDCVYYPESMSQMLDDYKALYLEVRELLESIKHCEPHGKEETEAMEEVWRHLTKHNDLTNHKDE